MCNLVISAKMFCSDRDSDSISYSPDYPLYERCLERLESHPELATPLMRADVDRFEQFLLRWIECYEPVEYEILKIDLSRNLLGEEPLGFPQRYEVQFRQFNYRSLAPFQTMFLDRLYEHIPDVEYLYFDLVLKEECKEEAEAIRVFAERLIALPKLKEVVIKLRYGSEISFLLNSGFKTKDTVKLSLRCKYLHENERAVLFQVLAAYPGAISKLSFPSEVFNNSSPEQIFSILASFNHIEV